MLRSPRHWLSVGALAIAAAPFACGGHAASNLAKPPEFNPGNQSKCAVRASQTEPLIVEWPPAERGRLEASVRRGLIAVRYVGCEMQLVPECRVKSGEDKDHPPHRKNNPGKTKN